MITLYTWTTPNGRKPAIMLEEVGLPYRAVPVNIGKDEQFAADFLEISPNNKIPAIVDEDAPGGPLSIFESGAILTYLADVSGQLMPASGAGRYKVLEWVYWQIGGLGPMLGQLGFFVRRAPEKLPIAIDRFREECDRLLGVMDRKLAEDPYLAGADYSIADIACYPWVHAATGLLAEPLGESIAAKPALRGWIDRVAARPAVEKGMNILAG